MAAVRPAGPDPRMMTFSTVRSSWLTRVPPSKEEDCSQKRRGPPRVFRGGPRRGAEAADSGYGAAECITPFQSPTSGVAPGAPNETVTSAAPGEFVFLRKKKP